MRRSFGRRTWRRSSTSTAASRSSSGSPTRSSNWRRAIHATSAGGSTALHNAVYIALKELAKIKAKNPDEIRRQAIVVLSDGEDTSSLVTFEEVLELAKRSETAIYTIGLQPRETSALKGFREAEFVLRQLAQETGGRAFFAKQIDELKDVYGQIADELSSQYSMGYASKNPRRDGAFRRIVVQVARPTHGRAPSAAITDRFRTE